MKAVPGVIALLFHVFDNGLLCFFLIESHNSLSCTDLKRLLRCCFIFATGATPSIARNIPFLGLT
jgi:hypothetical protein